MTTEKILTAARGPKAILGASAALLTLLGGGLLALALPAAAHPAQSAPSSSSADAYGSVRSAIPNGTRFLVGLKDELSTRKTKPNKRFKAKTLEPLIAPDGTAVPPGAEVRGHVSRVEPATLTGRARLWLTFDEISTPHGKLPLVADLVGVPGDHSVRQGESKEGEIEARTSKGRREAEAAAAGAAIGAAAGAAAKGGKGAAIGAVAGGAAGFLIASGVGQELTLPKGDKLELELTRPLYLAKK